MCGMTVDTDGQIRAEHDGRTFVFCSSSCRDRFVASPDRYADVTATDGGTAADSGDDRGHQQVTGHEPAPAAG